MGKEGHLGTGSCPGSESHRGSLHSAVSNLGHRLCSGADLRPKGRASSRYFVSFHCMASSLGVLGLICRRSSGPVLGSLTKREGEFCRLTNRLVGESLRELSMSSFDELPAGDDRSIIICHFPGWLFLGITPNELSCRLVCTRLFEPIIPSESRYS